MPDPTALAANPFASLTVVVGPAVLTNACSVLALGTGNRLARVVDRTRVVTREVVEAEVSDTGCGVTPENKEKLFQPYFSTKNRGTGLGLAIVNRIVSEHNGTIRTEKNDPVGTRFIIELPTPPAS